MPWRGDGSGLGGGGPAGAGKRARIAHPHGGSLGLLSPLSAREGPPSLEVGEQESPGGQVLLGQETTACAEQLFAAHTAWLRLLAGRPAFLQRLSPSDRSALAGLLTDAAEAVANAGDVPGASGVPGRSSRGPSITWDALTPELASLVFGFLDPRDAAAARAVCARWRAQLSSGLRALRPAACPPPGWGALFPGLRTLDLSGCKHYRVTRGDMAGLTELQELRVPSTISTSEMAAIQPLTGLSSLNLARCYDVSPNPLLSQTALAHASLHSGMPLGA